MGCRYDGGGHNSPQKTNVIIRSDDIAGKKMRFKSHFFLQI